MTIRKYRGLKRETRCDCGCGQRMPASEGERTLSPSSVKRWLIKLEGLGLVKRRVVMGGDGGTTSVASLA